MIARQLQLIIRVKQVQPLVLVQLKFERQSLGRQLRVKLLLILLRWVKVEQLMLLVTVPLLEELRQQA